MAGIARKIHIASVAGIKSDHRIGLAIQIGCISRVACEDVIHDLPMKYTVKGPIQPIAVVLFDSSDFTEYGRSATFDLSKPGDISVATISSREAAVGTVEIRLEQDAVEICKSAAQNVCLASLSDPGLRARRARRRGGQSPRHARAAQPPAQHPGVPDNQSLVDVGALLGDLGDSVPDEEEERFTVDMEPPEEDEEEEPMLRLLSCAATPNASDTECEPPSESDSLLEEPITPKRPPLASDVLRLVDERLDALEEGRGAHASMVSDMW